MGDRPLPRFLECGRIVGTHGCRGGVRVDPWTDAPGDLGRIGRVFVGEGEEKRELRILRSATLQGRFLLLELQGVTDMDAADALRGRVLYAAREDVPLREGQYFLSDVIGLPVEDVREGREGRILGRVKDILPGTASRIYVVETGSGDALVPAVPAFIEEVVPGERVRMRPIDGMFDDGDGKDA